MEEDTKHLHSLQSLDIKYLKSEKESLIKRTYVYSEQISQMEVEISDLKAMLQASQNENSLLNSKLSKIQEDLLKSKQKSKESIRADHESTEISKNTGKNDESIEDLYEEVNELREENQYFKGEYIPKLENQLENARLLINELEIEVECLNKENDLLKNNLVEKQTVNESFRSAHRRESIKKNEESNFKTQQAKSAQKVAKPKQKKPNYVPSIKRIEKNTINYF
jgi:regulator of replication initiation timing